MSHSMTGYGNSARRCGGYLIQIEAKSVNHRYCEVVVRMPREWTCYEDGLKRLVQRYIKRGRIDVYINKEQEQAGTLPFVLNTGLVESYLRAAEELRERYGLEGSLSAGELLSLPDMLIAPDWSSQEARNEEPWEATLLDGLEEAMINLVTMRKQEGEHLRKDLEERFNRLEELQAELTVLAPEVVLEYRAKLRGRLNELLDGAVDEHRFAMEVAVFADRSNIDEELIRLASHFSQCRELLGSTEPIGRKLDFLIQEMNRETNTIGSKANHLALVNRVVEMKAELEKIREQAANLE
ncbi:YicC/YloC family endoribonuclease [Paenibacillus brevis]|uniref:YicC family protein n=1 Tax=Paenibacillus brevis TaxID=2841508 RepID=A0ABS6FRP7_9BACL|nr:YicC/YloC family endoribonuclease [Paenibacillus brevis]MBU5672876.1 YicC family protein [Paenibacillus brevis]